MRRPLQSHELQLGRELRDLRQRAGLSCWRLGRVSLCTTRHLERLEQGARRTRRSTLERLVDIMVMVHPDLGRADELVAQLVRTAGPAVAPESPYAAKSLARRDGKVQHVADRRPRYAHLWD